MKECWEEFPDTSQITKQLPMWAKVVNQKLKITKSKLQLEWWQLSRASEQLQQSSVHHVHMSGSLSVIFSEYMRTEHLTRCTVPALQASVRLLHGWNTCSCLIISEKCSENQRDTFASWLPKIWFLFYSFVVAMTFYLRSKFYASLFAQSQTKVSYLPHKL